jgi:lipoprotein-releasing system permease protein
MVINRYTIIAAIFLSLAPLAALFSVVQIVAGPRLISKLLVRYLLKRRIAWVSLAAVMLCTAMVLVVISVMGGWLRMFRETNHALIGDLVVQRISQDGFSHYDEMIDQINALPEVKAATPVVRSYALAEMGLAGTANKIRVAVQATGIDIKQISQVNGFAHSLHLQKDVLLKMADRYDDEAAKNEAYHAQNLATAESLHDQVAIAEATANQEVEKQIAATTRADAAAMRKKAADFPSWDKPLSAETYRAEFSSAKKDPATWGGIVVGSGTIGLRRDDPRPDFIYKARVHLTILKVNGATTTSELNEITTSDNFWLIDDSETGVYQVDQNSVYLPFDVLQKDLNMDAQTITTESGEKLQRPARCNQILVALKEGTDLAAAKANVQGVVDNVEKKYGEFFLDDTDTVKVQTWEEMQHDILEAVEHEKGLLVILFGIISVVAIFLIFCIFFMIVMEKTRDIGIIKSVGATSSQVAGIFLGYGLTIGILGGGMGLLLAYLVVHNINQLHAALGYYFGVEIWSAKTYQFSTIPNTMSEVDVVVIVTVAVLSSVLGALVPAIRAARMNPVETLRWE